jgi:hypothetical protein
MQLIFFNIFDPMFVESRDAKPMEHTEIEGQLSYIKDLQQLAVELKSQGLLTLLVTVPLGCSEHAPSHFFFLNHCI